MILKNFIVFEGIDGAGTSTQIKLLKEREDADRFFFTTEPTDSETGKFLRKMLKGDVELDPRTSAFLFAADRNEHLYGKGGTNCGVVEKCESGKIVVSDRYLFSSLTYQCVTCGEELPRRLNESFPLPEILFFFDIDPEISLKRVISRGATEIYEKLDFQKETAARYRKIIDEYEAMNTGMKIIRLDATLPIEEVAKIINKHLEVRS
ncbi:dTMP kinase [uncultured Treponema sp.]|uniref:dTMP kinase n=1 Tax=uncultured Treponema sp. TaxID=162155 RepID=UPI0025FA7F73|nr:dTMP kinase [uncultured Treponema sp.]